MKCIKWRNYCYDAFKRIVYTLSWWSCQLYRVNQTRNSISNLESFVSLHVFLGFNFSFSELPSRLSYLSRSRWIIANAFIRHQLELISIRLSCSFFNEVLHSPHFQPFLSTMPKETCPCYLFLYTIELVSSMLGVKAADKRNCSLEIRLRR